MEFLSQLPRSWSSIRGAKSGDQEDSGQSGNSPSGGSTSKKEVPGSVLRTESENTQDGKPIKTYTEAEGNAPEADDQDFTNFDKPDCDTNKDDDQDVCALEELKEVIRAADEKSRNAEESPPSTLRDRVGAANLGKKSAKRSPWTQQWTQLEQSTWEKVLKLVQRTQQVAHLE